MEKPHIYIFLLIFSTLSSFTFAQEGMTSLNISDCSGAIELQPNENIQPRFTKDPGNINDLKAYSNQLEEIETNSLWLKFSTNSSGILRLATKKSNLPLEYSLFILNADEGCLALINGEPNLVRHAVVDKSVTIFKIDYKS